MVPTQFWVSDHLMHFHLSMGFILVHLGKEVAPLLQVLMLISLWTFCLTSEPGHSLQSVFLYLCPGFSRVIFTTLPTFPTLRRCRRVDLPSPMGGAPRDLCVCALTGAVRGRTTRRLYRIGI